MIKKRIDSVAFWTVASGAILSFDQPVLLSGTLAYAKCVTAASDVVETVII